MVRLLARAVCAGLLVMACAGQQKTAPDQIRTSTAGAVARCTPVGIIEERIESPSPTEGLAEQVADAVNQRASKLGATDVVYDEHEADQSYAYAKAEAFRCER